MIRCQENIILHLQELCYSLVARADVNFNDDPQLKDEDRTKILDKIVQISKVIFENGDYNFHYGLMVVVYTHLAAVEVRLRTTIRHLKICIKRWILLLTLMSCRRESHTFRLR